MLGSKRHNWILRQVYSTIVITFQWNVIKSYPKVFKLLLHPKTLSTKTSSYNVFNFKIGFVFPVCLNLGR